MKKIQIDDCICHSKIKEHLEIRDSILSEIEKSSDGKLVYFTSIDSAKFRKPVKPGEVLHIYIEKLRGRGSLWKFSGVAKVNNQIVSECIFSAMIVDAG